jgi:hypothetical protein
LDLEGNRHLLHFSPFSEVLKVNNTLTDVKISFAEMRKQNILSMQLVYVLYFDDQQML